MGETPDTEGLGIRPADRVLWCLAAAMALVIWFLPDRTTLTTLGGLVLLAVFLIVPALNLSVVRSARPGWSRRLSHVLVVIAVIPIVTVFGLWRKIDGWLHRRRTIPNTCRRSNLHGRNR